MDRDQDNPYASPQNAQCLKRASLKMPFPTVALVVSAGACALWFVDVILCAEPIFYPYDEIVVVFAATIFCPAGAAMGIYSCIFYKGWQSWMALFLGVGSFLFTSFMFLLFVRHPWDILGPYSRVYIDIAELLGIDFF